MLKFIYSLINWLFLLFKYFKRAAIAELKNPVKPAKFQVLKSINSPFKFYNRYAKFR